MNQPKYKINETVFLTVITGYYKENNNNICRKYMDIPMIISSFKNNKYNLVREGHKLNCKCCKSPHFMNVSTDKLKKRL